jgi:hypothetical protein
MARQPEAGDTVLGRTLDRIPQKGADVKFESRHLEDYFTWEHVYPFSDASLPLLGTATFVSRLGTFTTAMESQVLYAHSRYQEEGMNLLQQSAAEYISLAREAGVPVVSYFCQLTPEEPPVNRTRESVELSALLCAMIRQLIHLLPADFHSPALAFNAERFAILDGTLRTWDHAIGLFVELAGCVRLPILLFVIDGLNLLEDDFEYSTHGKLEQLIECLMGLVSSSSSEGDGRVVKVLFTTAGLSGPLCRELDDKDLVSCDTPSPGVMGRHRRAGQTVSFGEI